MDKWLTWDIMNFYVVGTNQQHFLVVFLAVFPEFS